jgi:hypothetical protein
MLFPDFPGLIWTIEQKGKRATYSMSSAIEKMQFACKIERQKAETSK